MSIYLSPRNNQPWVLQAYRIVVAGAGRESRIRNEARELDMRYLCVTHRIDGGLQVAFSTEKECGDFAAKYAAYCADNNIENSVYVEAAGDNALIVVIENGVIKQDRSGTKSEIDTVLATFTAISSASDESNERTGITFKFVDFNFLDEQQKQSLNDAFPNSSFESLSLALTDTFSIDDVLFRPEREALNRIERRRPWLLYGAVFIVAMLLSSQLIKTLTGNEGDTSQQDVVAPFESFYSAMSSDVVQVHARLAQDYNVHVGLLTIPGWTLDKVILTKGLTTYRLISDGGNLDTLEKFAASMNPKLHVMISSNDVSVSLIGQGINLTTTNEPKLFNVEQVHQYLVDAVTEYIPNAEILFLRDVPKGGKEGQSRWFVRELSFNFRGIHKEDLITLGAIAKGTGSEPLPISLGGDSSDPTAGQYIVDGERYTGSIKISVYGDKQ